MHERSRRRHGRRRSEGGDRVAEELDSRRHFGRIEEACSGSGDHDANAQAYRPSGWTDGVEFVAGQGDAAAFPYNDMCLVGGKFARILSFCPDEADMLCVETKHAVSDTAGSSDTCYLGPTVLGKLAPGVAEEACRHHGVV